MKLFTVHGINTTGLWARKLEESSFLSRARVDFRHYNYGKFGITKFLTPRSRRRVIDGFIKFYDSNTDKDERPLIIAHSFGTWIVTTAIKMYPAVIFDRVIFFGSILNPETNLDIFFKRNQVKSMLHQVGNKDGVVVFSRFVLGSEAGNSGEVGFATVPYKYKKRVTQEEYKYFEHSSASFMQKHIEATWVPFLLDQEFNVNPKILREEALGWISYDVPSGVSFEKKEFQCRVDRLGNYYARYTLTFRNNSDHPIAQLPVSISADSTDKIEDMQFLAMDESRVSLPYKVVANDFHRWKIEVSFPNVEPGELRTIRYKFKMQKTMRYAGDFDHFHLRGTKFGHVEFTSFYRLSSPHYFTIRDGRLTSELRLTETSLDNGMYLYTASCNNQDNDDGLIFYYDGFLEEKTLEKYYLSTRVEHQSGSANYLIRNVKESDLAMLQGLESNVDHPNRAGGGTIMERIRMFPDGFLVVEYKKKLVGYIESLRWNPRNFSTFDDIKDFPLHFDPKGDEVYIIFLAVANAHRRRGIASKLLGSVEEVARKLGVTKLALVAKSQLELLYHDRGYSRERILYNFLSEEGNFVEGVLMRKPSSGPNLL